MHQPLEYSFTTDAIHLSGALVFNAHPRWRQMLRQMPAPQKGTEIRLDMAAIDHLDAAGLGLLLITHDSLKAQQARLVLSRPTGAVRRVLEVSGFTAMVRIED